MAWTHCPSFDEASPPRTVEGVSGPRNIMPSTKVAPVARLPQPPPKCNNSNAAGRIGVALALPRADLRVGPLRKNRELTMRTSHPLSILDVTHALATTGWAVTAAAPDAGVHAVDASEQIIVTDSRPTATTIHHSAVPTDPITAAAFVDNRR